MVRMAQTTLEEKRMKSILDPSFRYTSSVETDLRKTFARIRREQRKQVQPQPDVQASPNILQIRQRRNVGPS